MRRYIMRFIHHIEGLPDFSALKFTKYNQYESLVKPLISYLKDQDVYKRQVRDMGETIKIMSKGDKWLNAKLVVFANAVEDNPFMAGAFHGVGEADTIINVGVSGPGVVKRDVYKRQFLLCRL